MRLKFPFSYVEKQLEKIYEKEFCESDTEGIDKHCFFIKKFIESYGWTEDDYILALNGESSNSYELIF